MSENAYLSAAAARRREPNGTGHPFLLEHQFISALCVERRRSERSGHPFLLALVHLNSAVNRNGNQSRLEQMLSSVVRETDAVGWYERGRILGLIFTCLAKSTESAAIDIIDNRLHRVLCQALGSAAQDCFQVTYHVFPETAQTGDPADPMLYPDTRTSQASTSDRFLKRCMDISGSILALAVLWPVMLVVAVLIKLTSKGPVLFKQERIGQAGRTFTFLKFRSMYDNNDHSIHREYVTRLIAGEKTSVGVEGSPSVFKIITDPRVTPIGRFLRKSSLDELPQFINVLKGEMSLIGPRPPVPYEYERYCIWHRRRVIEVKPGITGLWQVNGRSKTTFDDMVRLDLQYVRCWSVWLDLRILLRTPAAVISGDGAY